MSILILSHMFFFFVVSIPIKDILVFLYWKINFLLKKVINVCSLRANIWVAFVSFGGGGLRGEHHHLVVNSALPLCCWKHHRIIFFIVSRVVVDVGRLVTGDGFSSSFLSYKKKKNTCLSSFVFSFSKYYSDSSIFFCFI